MQSEVVDQFSATLTSVSALISVIIGIITYAITQYRKVKKEELTERDKWIMEAMKGTQLATQKTAETIGQNKDIIKAMYETNIPDEYKKAIEEKVTPVLRETDVRLQKANEQAAMIKARAVQIFGEKGDVDKDPTIPREDPAISMKLRTGGTGVPVPVPPSAPPAPSSAAATSTTTSAATTKKVPPA